LEGWKFIAETGAIYWKKLEIFLRSKTWLLGKNGHSMQIWPFWCLRRKIHQNTQKPKKNTEKPPKNSDFLRFFDGLSLRQGHFSGKYLLLRRA